MSFLRSSIFTILMTFFDRIDQHTDELILTFNWQDTQLAAKL